MILSQYHLSFTEPDPERPNRRRTVELGTREGSSARAVLDAFVAEKGVAESYTHGNRNSVWGLGAPTLTARKVSQ